MVLLRLSFTLTFVSIWFVVALFDPWRFFFWISDFRFNQFSNTLYDSRLLVLVMNDHAF